MAPIQDCWWSTSCHFSFRTSPTLLSPPAHPPPPHQLLQLVASLRARLSLLMHWRLAAAARRLPAPSAGLEAGASAPGSNRLVTDGLLLWPWQAAAQGDEGLREQLAVMPAAVRETAVGLAVGGVLMAAAVGGGGTRGDAGEQRGMGDTLFAEEQAVGMPGTSGDAGTDDGAWVSEEVEAARATAAFWGVDVPRTLPGSVGPVDEEALASQLALLMNAPVRYGRQSVGRGVGPAHVPATHRPGCCSTTSCAVA